MEQSLSSTILETAISQAKCYDKRLFLHALEVMSDNLVQQINSDQPDQSTQSLKDNWEGRKRWENILCKIDVLSNRVLAIKQNYKAFENHQQVWATKTKLSKLYCNFNQYQHLNDNRGNKKWKNAE